MGYVSFIQTEHQLMSPVIPSSIVFEIAKHYVYISLPVALLFLLALCFYFFQKRVVVIILTSLGILAYFILSNITISLISTTT